MHIYCFANKEICLGMKKITLIMSLLMVAALLLAACGGADANDTAGTPGVPGGVATGTLPADGGIVETVAAPTVGVEPTEAMPVVDATATLPMVEPTVAPTDAAPATTGTPGAQVPVTGDDDCNPYTVQGLLDMEVVDAEGDQIGDVDSLIVLRDTTALNMSAAMGAAAGTGTPQAPEMAATAPAATDPATTDNELVTTAAPQVAYVIVDVENEDNGAVVPLQAFDLTIRDRDVQGNDAGAATAVATVDPNQTPASAGTDDATVTDGTAGDAANELDVCAITLNNVQADAFSDVPLLDPDLDFSVNTWDEAFRTYWMGQGVVMPPAAANMGAPLILGDAFNSVDARNANGDDLGEMEDFFLEQDTGNISYGVLATGGFLGLGERRVPVPANRFQWVSDDPGDVNDAGYVLINLNEGAWQNAPTLGDTIDTTVEGWDEAIRAYWDALNGTTP
ncbi:MAG: hypothetical protein EHM21_01295 [Chloroflexi bacterium]|nr:MAG: hypothetical protein EHM21_01295 [Chloroflexota bacterium]